MIRIPTIAFLLMFVPHVNAQIIAVGGGYEDAFLPIFIDMSGGKTSYVYILAAARIKSEDQIDTFNEYEKYFRSIGVTNISYDLIMSKKDANNSSVLLNLSKATGICVSGGDQSILMNRIIHTKFHKLLLDKVKAGMIYYGNSAGTAIIGDTMIYEENKMLHITEGLSILDHIIFDTHFSQRKRQDRLKKSLVGKDDYIGLGIDERTAIIFHDNKKEVIGEGKVYEVK